ncbi:RNA polymerase sigma factor [Jejudonia soesokkakensis]|uniref:RNA polymerase sigma factor n=1 Tax=Jejudonia soesokkakensis TaxID=1323432 RepID=A0ABW2MVP6_9FLAO
MISIETAYTTFKSYFTEILKSRGFTEEKSVALYQDALVSLFQKEDTSVFTTPDTHLKRKINEYVEASVEKLNSPIQSLSASEKTLLKQYKSLPKSQQEILKLYFYHNLSVVEISDLKKEKISSVSELKNRGVKRLQHLIKTNGA